LPGDRIRLSRKGEIAFLLADDHGATNNIAAQHPDIVTKMSKLLDEIHEKGRSRP